MSSTKPLSIPLDGKDITLVLQEIALEKLFLDEANPRISFFKDNQPKEKLKENEIVFALTNKKPEAFRKLKDSIHNNKGIMYPIWVESQKGRYKVIEGNTRVVVYKLLSKEEPNERRWKAIPAYILPGQISEGQKDFIRLQSHLRGITPWDAYEKAKYLFNLWEQDGWTKDRLEKQTKMTKKQIDEAIEAYQLMEEQYLPNHGDDPNEVSKFSYFVEYVKDKKLKKLVMEKSKGIEDFCDWVSDKEKLPTGQDVRRLRDVLEVDEARKAFLKKGFSSAMEVLECWRPNVVSRLYRDIESITDALKNLSANEIDEIISDKTSEKEKLIKNLAMWSQKITRMIESEKHGIRKT